MMRTWHEQNVDMMWIFLNANTNDRPSHLYPYPKDGADLLFTYKLQSEELDSEIDLNTLKRINVIVTCQS